MKFGISEQGFRRLAQELEGPVELYHVTYSGNLESIAQNGLQAAYGEGIGGAGYEEHKKKGIFLTDSKGASFWFNKSEDWGEHRSDNMYESGLTPIVLQVDVPDPSKLIPDEIGSQDTSTEAWIYLDDIPPENIYFWEPENEDWFEVVEYNEDPLDFSIAYDVEEGDDRDEETGEPKDLYYHKMDSPFFPKFDED